MKRSTPLRRSAPLAPRAKPLSFPRTHADALLEKLAETLYARPEWGLVTEVRNHAGRGGPEVLRRADGIARDLYPPPGRHRFHFLEVKLSRADWREELKNPAKRGPFELHCNACYLVVPAPYKNVTSLAELPPRWGLIEVGTGEPRRVVLAEERDAEPPTEGFERALFCAALARRDHLEAFGEAPLSPIVKIVDRMQAQLGCGHMALLPLLKALPRALPCFSCEAGLPADRVVVRAALRASNQEERDEYRALLDELDGKACACRDADPVFCMKLQLEGLGLPILKAAELAMSFGCRCACHGGRDS